MATLNNNHMPKGKSENIARNPDEQVRFAYMTLLERIDLLQTDLLETAERCGEESETGVELRLVHARIAEMLSKNIKIRHRIEREGWK